MGIRGIFVLAVLISFFVLVSTVASPAEDPVAWEKVAYVIWLLWFGFFALYLFLYWWLRYKTLLIKGKGAEEYFLENSDEWQDAGMYLFLGIVFFTVVVSFLDTFNILFPSCLVLLMRKFCPNLSGKIITLRFGVQSIIRESKRPE